MLEKQRPKRLNPLYGHFPRPMQFAEKVLNTYARMRKEIEPHASEYDVRHRIIKYIVEGLLGYQGKDYQAEKNRTDVKLLDETHSLVLVVVETKKPTVDISEGKWRNQAFGYADPFTKYVVLTNGMKLKIWNMLKRRRPIVDLDFESILGVKGRLDRFSFEEKAQISAIYELSRDNLWGESKYQDFVVPAKIDIRTDEGFQKLLEKLSFIMNQLLMGYTLRAFDEYLSGHKQYEADAKKLEEEAKIVKGNRELEVRYGKERMELDARYRKFTDFHRGYIQWLRLSGREDNSEAREVFCKETVYVLLNKILLVRISEDKKLVPRRISNSGIDMWRQFAGSLKDSYKDLLEFTYKDIGRLYSHLYEKTIFDWYAEGDGELNKALNRVLYVLNHFDFREVDRDILGKLYEKYLPKEERKRLGEFYTPDEVIEHILDAVGYSPENEIEGRNLLDPACGSGGFLVKAVYRLIERYRRKGIGPKEIINNVVNHIYGLDINPFACHIAEMNILFQLIDLYQKAKEQDADYVLPRFRVYQTDSLEPTKEGLTRWQYQNSRLQKFLGELDRIDGIKESLFDYVVGNPPYVRKESIPRNYKESVLREGFPEIYHGDNDLSVYFIGAGIKWLEENGRLGFIVSRKFAKTRYGELIRRYIPSSCVVEEFVDFGVTFVFRDITNYPCILILKRVSDEATRRNNVIRAALVKKEMAAGKELLGHISRNIEKAGYSDEYLSVFEVDQIRLSDPEWNIVSENVTRIFTKIEQNASVRLKEISRVYFSLKTGANDILIVDGEKIERLRLEKAVLRPILRGEDIKRYTIRWTGNYLIFPYVNEGNEYRRVDIENFDNLFDYLSKHRERLANRTDIKGSASKWYELRPCSYYNVYESERIVTPDIAPRNSFAYESGKYLCLNTCFMILPNEDFKAYLRHLLGILNSKTLEFYFKQISTHVRERYFRYMREYLEPLPIKIPQTAKERAMADSIERSVNLILELEGRLQVAELRQTSIESLLGNVDTIRLDDYPSVVLTFQTNELVLVRRDGNKVHLNLTDYIESKDELVARYLETYVRLREAELRGVKDLRAEVCRIPIPKSSEDLRKVLLQHESAKTEVHEFPEKIKAVEGEIDRKVYDLYGLTEEDINVIEGSIAAGI